MLLKNIISASFLFVAISSISVTQAADVNWGYFQHGEDEVVLPEKWGEHFPNCNGFQQSPINIQDTNESETGEFHFNYHSTPLKIINNGHTIEVEYEPGSSMTINNTEYRLLQFHFHTPSEHLVNGHSFPMEMHLVHTNTSGELAVIGVLIEEGKKHKTFANIIKNAPLHIGEVEISGKHINISDLLPDETEEYFNYAGSLTTPPCSEGVNWFVMEESITFSKKQIHEFENVIHLNARPVQEINSRIIYKNDD